MRTALSDKYWSWAPHVLAIEIKKAVSYRVDFWIQFFIGTFAEIAIAYFLWKAVFQIRGVARMEGYSFHGLIYYYLFATFSMRIARGNDRGYVSQDIYDGGLTRYLLYPLPFLGFKFITHFSQQILFILQLLLAFALLAALLSVPIDVDLTPLNFCAGIFTCMCAGYLHFMMTACLEMVAFWQDVVWNLMVMLRFTLLLLGGGMIPLAFFPAWGQRLVAWTPFPMIISFPVKTFMGQLSFQEWLLNAGLLVFWSALFTVLIRFIWRRGLRQYSGVGI